VGAGAGSFCLGLALGALDLGEARQWQQIATANQQALIASPGPLPTGKTQSPAPPSVPPTLLARLEQLEEQRPDPRRLFHQLSELLDRTPGLRLTRLEWAGEEAGETPSPLSASTGHPLPQGPHLALEGEIQEEEGPSPVRREADFATPLNQFRAALEANAQLQGRIQGDATGSSPSFRGEIWSENKP